QSLPNPQQRDGRDGSWSSYPGSATLEHIQDGSNGGVVHFKHDTSAVAYGGVSLAFLGGNGAGSCYDASAYQGIEFDIKGSVVDPRGGWDGGPQNQYTLSLVSAPTQTSSYGGDAPCAMGHYYKQMDSPTGSYTTVRVPWSDFVLSNYVSAECTAKGIGHSNPTLAKVLSSLQAIDWGCTSDATTCDIYLDNIRLY
ncbi:MAG: CIA30 family protein, partial [Proteobacteria bacterium]|nr:CIA30 family protein [Pseudomonadota bacterium]